MKIKNLNTAEPVTSRYTIPPEEHILHFYLSAEDTQALNRLLSRWQCLRVGTYQEAITKAIEQRNDIKELILTPTGRHNNNGQIWLEKDVRKKILNEASKYGLDPGDYIRGIIYSVHQKIMQDEIEKRERQNKIRHDNRVLSFTTTVKPDIREKLYKKYGKRTDKDLMAALQKDAGEWMAAWV